MTSDGCVGGGPAKRSKSSRLVWGWVGVLGCSDGGVFGALDGKVGCCVISSRGDFGGDFGCEAGCEIGCEIGFAGSSVFCIGISTTGLVCEVGVLGGVLGGAVGCDFGCCCCGCDCCVGCDDGAVVVCCDGICGFSSFSFFFLLSELNTVCVVAVKFNRL